MQTAVNKAIRVGKVTMLAIGLGVSLALVLGAATVALAAVPGDPLKLGKVNVINDATTTLRGGPPSSDGLLRLQRTDGTGATLRVENTAGGIARGIDIVVPQGKPPIVVSGPNSATASGLSADRLDGKNATEFLPRGTYVAKDSRLGPGGGDTAIVSVNCDSGDRLLGGGGNADSPDDDTLSSVPFLDEQGWDYRIQDNGAASVVDVNALCADYPPERQ